METPPGTQPDDPDLRAAVAAAVSHFNARRYWHAHDGWRQAVLLAPRELRPFYEGLLLVTWGLAHVQERRPAPARRELMAGLEMLGPYRPVLGDLIVEEVVDMCIRLAWQLDEGVVPYLIPPLLKYADAVPTTEPSTAQ